MELKLMKPDSPELDRLEEINKQAFPMNEYIPIRDFYQLGQSVRPDVWAMIQDGQPAGFTVLLQHQTCVYIFYLAVDSSARGGGCGSETLRLLPELYPGCQIVVDFEVVTPTATNNDQRIRRTGFYRRNGFHMTTLHLFYMQDEFVAAWMGNGDDFDRQGFLELLAELHRQVPAFDPRFEDKPF